MLIALWAIFVANAKSIFRHNTRAPSWFDFTSFFKNYTRNSP